MKRFFVACALAFSGSAALACSVDYVVQPGQTLSTIADLHYKDASKWRHIHEKNLSIIGDEPAAVRAGQVLSLDCIDTPKPETVARQALEPLSAPQPKRVRMLTGGDIRPFVNATSPDGGMLTEIMQTAMTEALGADAHRTYWLSNWSDQVDLILGGAAMEIAFPYAKPDCTRERAFCEAYHFSDPMFEFLELLYVDAKKPLAFTEDSDLEGRTLCRPRGHQVHLLNAEGRDWVDAEKVVLKRPALVSDCFFKLLAGDVDAVVLNEFTARQTLALMGLEARVIPFAARPVAVSSLHAIIHKDHPEGRRLWKALNASLRTLRENGTHAEIVSRNLAGTGSTF